MKQRVLVVDDDASFREVLRFHLKDAGIACDVTTHGKEALEIFNPAVHPLVLTDLKMPHMDGLSLLRAIKQRSPETLTIVITAFGELSTAVEAMKSGAFDFLPKPCDRDHIKLTVRKALEHAALRSEVRELKTRLDSEGKEIVYRSRVMEKLMGLIDRIAPSDTTVLILGESGTGKELIARRIHRLSPRAQGPFVAFNCAAFPRELLESELFGHVRGAFTGAVRDRQGRFEQADSGSIFLDEIGDLPLDLQTRLLRVLQERRIDIIGKNEPKAVDVRIISATHRDLRKAVDAGSFREDLYFRLAVIPIEVPPLRDRRDDIALLVEHFLRRYGADRSFALSDGLVSKLESFEWRGNVRELENVCQRLALLAEDDLLTEELLPEVVQPMDGAGPSVSSSGIVLPPDGLSLVDLERDVIIRALEMKRYNQTQTARFLRIPRHVLLYRIEKYQIPLRDRS